MYFVIEVSKYILPEEIIRNKINVPIQNFVSAIVKDFLDFGKEKILDFDNSRELFSALVEILSLAESKKVIEENFKDLLDNIYQN